MSAAPKVASFLASLERGRKAYGVSFPRALAAAVDLYSRGEFSPKEILGYALFAPQVRASFPVLISKERSLARLGALNPPEHQHLTERKDEFALACAKARLPVPRTIAWTRGGRMFDGGSGSSIEESWIDWLDRTLPAEFVAKDIDGAYGSGFQTYRREDRAFIDGRDQVIPGVEGLVAQWVGAADDVILQERLFDAQELTALCGRRSLQTARINTLLHEDGSVDVLFAMIKVLASESLTDNFSMGTSGNLIAFGNAETGVLNGAIGVHPSGCGMVRVERHPGTGIPFEGFVLPHWHEALELVRHAQRCFPQLPSLGWDVALTADGPRLIEANARWDPPTYAPFLMSEEHWRSIFGGGPSSPRRTSGAPRGGAVAANAVMGVERRPGSAELPRPGHATEGFADRGVANAFGDSQGSAGTRPTA